MQQKVDKLCLTKHTFGVLASESAHQSTLSDGGETNETTEGYVSNQIQSQTQHFSTTLTH